MVGFSYGELRDEYADLWDSMKIPAGTTSAVDARIRAIARGRPRYEQVANATGVPWYVIAIIHEMEASLKFTHPPAQRRSADRPHLPGPGRPAAGRHAAVRVGRQRHRRADDEEPQPGEAVVDRAHRLPARGLQRLGLSHARDRRQHALPVEFHHQLQEGQVRPRPRVRPQCGEPSARRHGLAAPPDRDAGRQRPERGGRAAAGRAAAAPAMPTSPGSPIPAWWCA